MKRQLERLAPLFLSFFLFWSLATVSVGLTGCGTWQQTTYKTAGTITITADTAMKAWAEYVVAGHAKPDQEVKVRDAYAKYQAAMLTVLDVGKAATANGSTNGLQQWFQAATAAQAHLVDVVNAFLPAEKKLELRH